MKTAIWLYIFLFVAFFDLHAQYPILTPFAISLGAAPSFIGLMMGLYSLTHLPGNLIAGYSVDRYGSRLFIVISLLLAGVILLIQSRVTDPWQLLVLRSISGFVLAFLSPACMSLLARLSQDQVKQGKLMAGNGLVHTLASIVSPAAGALLVAKIGFATAFTLLGIVLIATAICALFFIRNPDIADAKEGQEANGQSMTNSYHLHHRPVAEHGSHEPIGAAGTLWWLFFLLPIAISCSQGILFFELPLLDTSEQGMLATGFLFSIVSIGSLITLSMLFLNRFSPFIRSLLGALVLAIAFFILASGFSIPLYMLLLLIGMSKGIIYPAMSLLLIELSGRERYGRMFSLLSIAFSFGAFIGPMAAGQLREYVSSYYVAFVVLMLAISILPFYTVRTRRSYIF